MKRFTNICVAVASLGTAQVGASHAAPTIVGDHYEEYRAFSCGSTHQCRINFSLTPANKYLLVTYISCYLNTSQPVYIVNLGTSASTVTGTSRPYVLKIPIAITATGNFSYSFGQELAYLIGPSRYPYIHAQVSGTSNVMQYSCTLTGVLKDL
jgi:hypothetical protein